MNDSQKTKILNLVSDKQWHCTTEMARMYIVDYRRRLGDLQEEGYVFENRRCTQHSHPMKEWRLLQSPVASNLPPRTIVHPSADTCAKDYRCYHYRTFHYCKCEVKQEIKQRTLGI